MKRTLRWLVAGALALAPAMPTRALAQNPPRPSEEDIFGKPAETKPAEPKPEETKPEETKPEQKPAPETPTAEPPAAVPMPDRPTGEAAPASTPEWARDSRDDAILGAGAQSKTTDEAAPEDPLKIGGMFYLRSQATARQEQSPDEWSLSAPFLLDAFLDARPNDRVRGFVLGRMFFDPTLPLASAQAAAQAAPGEITGGSMGSADLTTLFGAGDRGPHAFLDQMWLRFDIARAVFVTAGKQHARWGTARFWSPTDFLHVRRRDPLAVFDARTGTTMLKLHVPWEALGWNFYAYGLLEDVDRTATVGQISGAGRAEIVFGTTEVGLGALVHKDRKPKLAVDISTGIWDLDFYGEMALRYGSEIDRVVVAPDLGAPPMESGEAFIERLYPVDRDHGVKPQVVGGVSYQRRYNDNDTWTLGVEYFYNALGYDSPEAYPGLILPRRTPLVEPSTFFYLGRQYGAVFLSLPAPYSWDYHTFTLSTLGNFSDGSYITRLDYSLLMLTHLRFEAYVAGRYGTSEGEFRFGVDSFKVGSQEFSIPPMILDIGVALRVSI
jgi:outer membrane biosynthesis protein TonB